MVKKVLLQGRIEFAEPQAVFSFLFGDDKFIKSYHKKVNNDPYAEATCWNENDEREVKYTASLKAPKMIVKIAGADAFPVIEVQKYTRHGNCFTITCNPLIHFPGGDRFVTCTETVLSSDGRGGCAVTVNVTLEFKGGRWGVEGAVESFMESKARTTFEEWITMGRLLCQEEMALLKLSVPEEEEEEPDKFFDVEDIAVGNTSSPTEESEQTRDGTRMNRILSRFNLSFLRNEESSSGLNTWFVQTVLRELNDVQISCEASRGHLEKLNAKLLRIEEDLGSVRSQLERQQVPLSKGTAWSVFGWGIATGLAVGFIYLRVKRQTGDL